MFASARTGHIYYNSNQALVAAIRNGQFEEIRNLLEHELDKIDINGYIDDESKYTPLWVACKTRDAKIVALLLQYGADPNHGDKEVFMNGKRYYSRAINSLIWFLMHHPETNDVLSHLLRCGADPNVIVPSNGWSLLHYVCRYADYDKIDLLLRNGANPNQLDRNGESPMIHMLSGPLISRFKDNHLSCLRLMLEHGADPNVISRCGTTPLLLLIRDVRGKCRLDAIRLMMRHGANMTIRIPESRTGDTILHAAVRLCDVDAILIMTECQAITKFGWLRNHNGETVYEVVAAQLDTASNDAMYEVDALSDAPSDDAVCDLVATLEAVPIIEYFDIKMRQWRQDCYAHLRYDWIHKKPTKMMHSVDDAERLDVDAAIIS